MRKCANISNIWGGSQSYMTLQLLHSEFPYIWGKSYFLFYLWIESSKSTIFEKRRRKTAEKEKKDLRSNIEELNIRRGPRSSHFWLTRNLSNHMDRQARTGDTLLRESRHVGATNGRGGWGEGGVKTTEIKIHWPRRGQSMSRTYCTNFKK